MKFRIFAVALVAIFSLFSCIEHEVVPPPSTTVDLSSTFIADIDGTTIEYVENVNGMYAQGTLSKEILPDPDPSSAIYFSEMKSNSQSDLFKIALGKVDFQASVTQEPSLAQFEAFMLSNTQPAFASGAEGGIEITYTDHANNVWSSDASSLEPQNFEFTSFVQESDENADYMKFEAAFNCKLFNSDTTDFISIENGIYKAFFKRK
ncbi:MAG: hypothetical protein ACPGU5_02940 [Lishizhenia sp.]